MADRRLPGGAGQPPSLPFGPGSSDPVLQRELERAPSGTLSASEPERHAELEAWLQLQATLGLSPERAIARLAGSGGPAAALRADGAQPRLSAAALREMLDAMSAHDIALLPIAADGYPPRLRRLVDAAPALFVQGDVAQLARRSVAIVGARAATVYGLRVARDLARALAAAGVVIVSGLARGVDSAAHEGALEAGGSTVAVQARGLDRVYPAAHRGLAARIRAQGAVVSELVPGSPPLRPYFPLRNRLIAGLAEVVVVVEARVRSGSLITARHALDRGIGTDVMAVPGPITAPTSEGPNQLIRDGARPVLSAGDVLEELGLPLAPTVPPTDDQPAQVSDTERRVLAALPASREALARRLALPHAELALALLELELAGRIREDRDGAFHAAS